MKGVNICKFILFFGSYLLVLLLSRATDITQMGRADDGFSLLHGARFMENTYPVPLWNFVGWFFANLPFGNDGGNVTLFLSVVPAFFTSILVFLIIKKKTEYSFAPWFGSATLMGCYVYFSQSVIIGVYMGMAFLFTLTYYLIVSEKWKSSAFISGLGMSIHYVTGIIPFVAFFLVFPNFRKFWYIPVSIAISFYLLGAFVFSYGGSYGASYSDLILAVFIAFSVGNVVQPYIGIWYVIQFLVVGFAFSLIPIWLYVKDLQKSYLLVFLCMVPLIYLLVGGSYIRMVQIPPYAPFFAIMAGLGIERLRWVPLRKVIFVCSILMLISSAFLLNMNILDERPTTARQAISELHKANDGDIILCVRLFEWEEGMHSDTLGGHVFPLVDYFNRTEERSLLAIKVTDIYRGISSEFGVEFLEDYPVKGGLSAKQEMDWYFEILRILHESNPGRNVYYFEIIDLETQKCILQKFSLA